jgi:hypothetical protein
MGKLIKRTSVFLGVIIGLVLLFLLLAPYFFPGSLKTLIEKEVNAQIKGEMVINGDAGISLLRHFPQASVSFQDIRVFPESSEDTLLATSRISFLFNMMDLFRGAYNVEKLVLGETRINLYTDQQGMHNYDIFKKDTTAATQAAHSGLSINIKEFSFASVRLNYINRQQRQEMRFKVANGLVSMGYDQQNAEILLEADVLPGVLIFGDIPYELPGKVRVSGGLNIDEAQSVYTFTNARIIIEDDIYKVDGLVEEKPYGLWVDLMARGEQVGLGSLWALAITNGLIEDWQGDSDGALDLSATSKGAMGSGRTPAVEAVCRIEGWHHFLFRTGWRHNHSGPFRFFYQWPTAIYGIFTILTAAVEWGNQWLSFQYYRPYAQFQPSRDCRHHRWHF